MRQDELLAHRARHIFAWALVAIYFGSVGCHGPGYYSEKYAPTPGMGSPRSIPGAVQPEPQLESHTCGYHALSAAYRAFDLNPDRANLRFRLGVDAVAIPLRPNTKGTLHPDLLRVIAQDGLRADIIALESPESNSQIKQHVGRGLPAMVLISRRETGGLHWVLFTGATNGNVAIADSLRPSGIYTESFTQFMNERVLSVLLLSAHRHVASRLSVAQAHKLGVAEMLRVYERLRRRQSPDQTRRGAGEGEKLARLRRGLTVGGVTVSVVS